jgi:hypothetical protein
MDNDGYPDESELKKIENWNAFKRADYLDLMGFVKSIWGGPFGGFWLKGAVF